MNLKKVREQIDIIDSKILKLLNDRMILGILSKRFKTEIEDIEREKEILDRINSYTESLVNTEVYKRIFLEIFSESKRLQKKNFKITAFQGEHGAYSDVAARKWLHESVTIPCVEFREVFDGVEKGYYDYGIVPVENTLGGVIGEVNDLLIKTKLKVVGAVNLKVEHCLLAIPGADHRELREVISHPQALTQCKSFIERNKLNPVSYYDTAGAARMIREKNLKQSTAIASKLAAELYDLEIIKENIADLGNNYTRFLILAREETKGKGDKCSIIFSTEHKAGTLFKVLEIFAKAGINLTRIESIPESPGSYAFFLDFIGSLEDETVKKCLNNIKPLTTKLKIMGNYREITV